MPVDGIEVTVPGERLAAAWAKGLGLAGIHVLLSVVWFGLIISAAHLARRALQAPRSVKITDRLTGLALLGFGTSLALKH